MFARGDLIRAPTCVVRSLLCRPLEAALPRAAVEVEARARGAGCPRPPGGVRCLDAAGTPGIGVGIGDTISVCPICVSISRVYIFVWALVRALVRGVQDAARPRGVVLPTAGDWCAWWTVSFLHPCGCG